VEDTVKERGALNCPAAAEFLVADVHRRKQNANSTFSGTFFRRTLDRRGGGKIVPKVKRNGR
jgi:hypothetical protein